MFLKRDIEKLSDAELIALYKRKGDKQLVGVLYKRYTGFVFAVCNKYLRNRYESSDAVMQIFEKLFDDLKIHQVNSFKSWLYTVAKNYCLQQLRKQKSKIEVSSEINSHESIMENATNMYHDGDDNLELKLSNLERELCNIPPEQRTCIELFYLQEKSYQEVSGITGYSLNQVKSYIQNGKRNLKISLSNNEG